MGEEVGEADVLLLQSLKGKVLLAASRSGSGVWEGCVEGVRAFPILVISCRLFSPVSVS